jgi:glycosyltransferase involved in cell wall biosynthesis
MRIAICFAQVPFVFGGAEALVQTFQQALANTEHEVDMINVPFKWYPIPTLLQHAIVWRQLDLTESNGVPIDLVVGTKFPSYLVKHPNKVIWLIHQHRDAYDLYGHEYSDFDTENPQHRAAREAIINMDTVAIQEAKKVYTISWNVSKRLKEYNGIDSTPLYPPSKYTGKLYSGEYQDYVLFVGRLDPKKRIDLLIQAAKYLNAGLRVVIVGTGNILPELKELAKQEKVEDRVEFTGFVSDEEVCRYYANALCVVYAPLDEDYGYSTVEAFLSEKPVITTEDAGGVLEFVEDGASGFVIPKNPKALAKKINYLHANKNICSEFGKNGYQRVEWISWDAVLGELLNV